MDKLAKDVEILFSKGVLSRARGLNLSKKFTDQQCEFIEKAIAQLMSMEGDQSGQRRYVSELNLETSLLLCAWLVRGRQHWSGDRILCK